jgi:hypothetical protein
MHCSTCVSLCKKQKGEEKLLGKEGGKKKKREKE